MKQVFKLGAGAAFAAALSLLGTCGNTFAQDAPATVAEAPPVGTQAPAAGSTVYNWRDVPVNQQIVIDRAVFDQGGYQLYCHTGETIVVPFENQNLYVMRFGQTNDPSVPMYFLSDGSTPTLFVQPNGYLENAAAAGAHWYPFPQTGYAYNGPVYMGVAPSYTAFVNMGWYPGMAYYGGYWGYHPYRPGVAFVALPGLFISIGGEPYRSWNAYHSYYVVHTTNVVYERSYAREYRYASYAPRGAAFYRNNPARSFPPAHAGAAGRAIYVRDAVRPGGAIGHNLPAARTSAAGFSGTVPAAARPAFGGGRPVAGSTVAPAAPRRSFGGVAPAGSGFGAPSAPRRAFGGASTAAPAGGRPAFGGGAGAGFGPATAHSAFGGGGASSGGRSDAAPATPRRAFGGGSTTPSRGASGGTAAPARPAFGGGGASAPARPAFGGAGSAASGAPARTSHSSFSGGAAPSTGHSSFGGGSPAMSHYAPKSTPAPNKK